MALGFESDIKPLFRAKDVTSMRAFGGFDLSEYTDVAPRADAILGRLRAGTMPCDGAWPKSDVDKFEQWISDGKLP